MTMLLKYSAMESFYDGFQKTSLFADRTVRLCTGIFVLFGLSDVPFRYLIPIGFKIESSNMIVLILLIFPISTILIGGISHKAWKLYAGFGIFFLLGLIPALWGFPVYLLFLLPSIPFLLLLIRAEPKILQCFGYSGKPLGLNEALIALLSAAIFFFLTFMATVIVQKTRFTLQSPLIYLLQFLIVIPKYFLVWGILYGILMKHLLELDFENMTPILVNIFLTLVFWFSVSLNVQNPAMDFIGVLAWAIGVNLIGGIAYVFTRSARPIFFAYALNYIIFVGSTMHKGA